MRTQIAKTEYLPAEYIPPTFLTRGTLPVFRRFVVGAAIEKNFFLILFFRFSLVISQKSGLRIFWILHSLFLSRKFFSWLRSYLDSYSILFRISVVLTHYKFSLDILLVYIRSILSRLRFLTSLLVFDSFLLVSSCVDFTLQLFISLPLLLVINKHLYLWEFDLCLF